MLEGDQIIKGEEKSMENQMDLWVESINTAIWHELNKIDKAGEDKAPDKSIRRELKEKAKEIYQKIKKDYVAYTEFVIALNHKCWDWYRIANATVDKKDEARKRAISKNYADLYYLYDNQFFEDYKENKKALQYFVEVTD